MDIKVEDIVVDPKLVDRTDGLDIVTVQTYAAGNPGPYSQPWRSSVTASPVGWLTVSTDWQLRNSLNTKPFQPTSWKGITAMRC